MSSFYTPECNAALEDSTQYFFEAWRLREAYLPWNTIKFSLAFGYFTEGTNAVYT